MGDTVEALSKRHEISALADFLESCRTFAHEKTLNIAVLGRFNAGKSLRPAIAAGSA